ARAGPQACSWCSSRHLAGQGKAEGRLARAYRAGRREELPDRLGPSGEGALGDLELGGDVLGGILAAGPDALDERRKLRLIPLDLLRQVGDDGDGAVGETDRAGVLARLAAQRR